MRAAVCRDFSSGTNIEIEEWPAPTAGPDEVVIEIAAAGVNYPDLLSVNGKYPIPSIPPFVPGVEGSGTVVATGEAVRNLAIGDRVCWQDNVGKGSFAEQKVLSCDAVARVPSGVDMVTAACFPTTYGTANFALNHRARLQPDETVLVYGATGGVGAAAIQLAKSIGATVIACSGTPSKSALLSNLGADICVDINRSDLRDHIMEVTGGRGVDVVVDPVGGEAFEHSMRVLAPYGRLLSIGFASGDFPVARANILLIKAISVIGVNYGHYLATEQRAASAAIENMLAQVASGNLNPIVSRSYALEQISDALGALQSRNVFGKSALIP